MAATVGAIVEAAHRRIPIILDGFIVGAAAIVAERLLPGVRRFVIAGHMSAEPGHAIQLAALGLTPLLTLDMRLGEGTGAAIALGIIEQAIDLATNMLTFDAAGVSRS